MSKRGFDDKTSKSSNATYYGSKRKSEQNKGIQPIKRHNSILEEACDSREQSAEKSLLETFIKHVSSFQSVSVLSKHDVGTFSSKQYPSDFPWQIRVIFLVLFHLPQNVL
jgi:isopentenyl diphosphate isomerase/L-lactate dehydrogenase-like FMN-dependent dehydrogenase